jgi:hypothetical protein
VTLNNSTFTVVAKLMLPAGSYLASAYAHVGNNDVTELGSPYCLFTGTSTTQAESGADLAPNTGATIAIAGPIVMSAGGTLQLSCFQADRTGTPNTNVVVFAAGLTASQVNLTVQ